MSDSNLTNKISETITGVFKKTKIFEKMEKMQFLVGTFVMITSIIGITSIYMNYSNSNKIYQISYLISENQETISNLNNVECIIKKLENKIVQLEFKIDILLGNQKNIMNDIKNLPIYKIQGINVSTSTSAFSPIKKSNINILYEDTEIVDNHRKINDADDNELLDECYDSIPLNNIKTTGLSWLFK